MDSVFSDCLLDIISPVNLRAIEDALARMEFDPFDSLAFSVVLNGLPKHVSHRVAHHLLDVTHPVLNLFTGWIYLLDEVDLLLLSRDHSTHSVLVIEYKIGNSLEDLLEERPNVLDFLGLGQDLEQLFIGEEEETREGASLLLQILSETLVHDFKVLVGLDELVFETVDRTVAENSLVLFGVVDDGPPGSIDTPEPLGLSLQLSGDISRFEDRLQVGPGSLAVDPLVQGLLTKHHPVAPLVDLLLKGTSERRELHGLGSDDVLIKQLHCIIETSNSASGGLLELRQQELERLPVCLHLLETLFDVVLLVGSFPDILAQFSVLQNALVDAALESKAFARSNILAYRLGDLVPVSFNHTLFPEGKGDWHDWFELVYLALDSGGYFKDLLETSLVFEEPSCHVDGLDTLLEGGVQVLWVDIL